MTKSYVWIAMKVMTDSMSELESILKIHAKRYQLMQPTDAVKLIYQNEFGGGHLIRDEESCLNYLRREYDSVTKDADMPLYEKVGNGIVRVNLAAVKPEDLEQLGKHFIRSAAEHTGTMERFLQKLDVLYQVTEQGIFSFGREELEEYIAVYQRSGCPAVSHSKQYHNTYHPAYRIIKGALR